MSPVKIHPSWHVRLEKEFAADYWKPLTEFVRSEYASGPCFPEAKNIFRAFDSVPFESVKLVILGQDPYHTPGAAMGMSFSIPNGSRTQPSLQNMFKELQSDLWVERTATDLSDWASEGVFLLNSVLTVRSGMPASHQWKGWETFTDAVIRTISEGKEHVVFVLWGNYAISKRPLIDERKHFVLATPHPSPFSAYRGFFGSKPFSRSNAMLAEWGIEPIKWD